MILIRELVNVLCHYCCCTATTPLIDNLRGHTSNRSGELTSEDRTNSMALLFQASSWLFLCCNSCWMLLAASSTRLDKATNLVTAVLTPNCIMMQYSMRRDRNDSWDAAEGKMVSRQQQHPCICVFNKNSLGKAIIREDFTAIIKPLIFLEWLIRFWQKHFFCLTRLVKYLLSNQMT